MGHGFNSYVTNYQRVVFQSWFVCCFSWQEPLILDGNKNQGFGYAYPLTYTS